MLGTVMVDGGEIFVGNETQFAIELFAMTSVPRLVCSRTIA